MNRTDRLYAIVEELRAAAPHYRSTTWLAERFEVSGRTIERDLAALQQSGVPIYATPGYSMIQLGDGAPIGGGIAHNDSKYPNDATFLVQVPDVAATLASVAEHGGSIVAEQQETPFGLSFGYAANPDGSVFGVWRPAAD